MRLAWFAPQPSDIAIELGHAIPTDYIDRARAHDFVWTHFTAPYDLTVFELGDSERHDFIWPYLFHYPGLVVLHAESLQHSRMAMLKRHRRHSDARAERAFSGWNLLRAPLLASRMVVVRDTALKRELEQAFVGLAVRCVPTAVAAPPLLPEASPPRFHIAGPRRDLVERAATRAREAGVAVTLADGLDDLGQNSTVIALEWPPTGGPPIDALRAMRAALPTIVLETEATAVWPTLDPQTWQRRSVLAAEPPIAVSLDPRDEEHSLMLAIRRLAGDAGLRTALGAAAGRWAASHADLDAAVARWRLVLDEARRLTPQVRRSELPPHLVADGSERARRILAELGERVDLLD